MKNENIEISVIMYVYNNGNCIKHAIESILSQTFPLFELIIINDASNDNSKNIIDSYDDRRISLVNNNENIGKYKSINHGVDISKGKYIAIMEADIIAFPKRLQIQYDYLEKNKNVLAIGSSAENYDGNLKKSIPYSYEDILFSLLSDNKVFHSSLFVRIEKLRDVGNYNENFKDSSDYDLICKLAVTGKIENLNIPLIKYIRHEINLSNMYNCKHQTEAYYIRREYQMKFIDKYKSETQLPISIQYLGYPEMGEVICYFTYYSYANDSYYYSLAENALDNIFLNTSQLTPVTLENGLIGIACGIVYLLKNQWIEGDLNLILSEIDEYIIYTTTHLVDIQEIDWYGILYYLNLRLVNMDPDCINVSTLQFKQNAIFTLDALKRKVKSGFQLKDESINEIRKISELSISPDTTNKLLGMNIENSFSQLVTESSDKAISFVIPFRIDSFERKRNLTLLIDELQKVNPLEILLIEGDSASKFSPNSQYNNVTHCFIEDLDPVFHRTKYINIALHKAKTKTVGIWDTDAFIPPKQIIEAFGIVHSGKTIMSFPFDGRFHMLTEEQSLVFENNRSYEELDIICDSKLIPHGPYSVGGAFCVNKDLYLYFGGENEHFYGWGPEDIERVKRVEILGYEIIRAAGKLFHLFHPRNDNSQFFNELTELANRSEFVKISSMRKEELLSYIESWN